MKWLIIILIMSLMIISPVLAQRNVTNDDLNESLERVIRQLTELNKQDDIRLSVFGTDYQPSDNATVFLQLINTNDGSALDNQSCKISLINRTRNGYVFEDVPMINFEAVDQNASDGLYFFDFTAPSENGVYPVVANCSQPLDTLTRLAAAFELINGTEVSGSFVLTHVSDSDEHKLRETGSDPRTFFVKYNFTGITGNFSNLFEVSATVEYSLHDSGSPNLLNDENYVMQALNFSNGECEDLVTLEPTIADEPLVRSFTGTGENIQNFVQNGTSIICFQDTIKNDTGGAERDQFNIDFLSVTLVFLVDAPVDSIRGSGEVNIRSITANISGNISAETNNTAIAEEVWSFFNRTLTQNISTTVNVTQIAEEVWSFNNRTLTGFNFLVNLTTTAISNIWSFATRTLTSFGFLVDAQVNQTSIAESVWNFSNRTLSQPVLINGTNLTINATIDPASIWNFPNRTLSTYCSTSGGEVGRCVWEFFWRADSVE